MLRLLRIEFAKVSHYKSFWIVLIFFALVIAGILNININEFKMSSTLASVTWVTGILVQIFLGYLAILLVSNEYECRTLRQHLMNGLSPIEVILSRLLFFVLIILGVFVFAAAAGLIAGTPLTEINLGAASFWQLFAGYFLKSLAYVSLAILVSHYCKRSISSLAIYFLWPMAIEPLSGWLLDKSGQELSTWLPTAIFAKTLSSPFASALQTEGTKLPLLLVITLAYTFLFWTLSYYKISRSDV